MSFDWTNYVLLSEELAIREEEACLRSSISRGYYGVFCIARNKMGYKDYKKANIHAKVIEELKNARTKDWRRIGWNLDELRRARNKADYNEDISIQRNFVERILSVVKKVLTNLEEI